MGASHEVWLTDPAGTPITLVEGWERLDYGMSVHNVGACTLVLPAGTDRTLYAVDNRLEIWRDYDGGHRQLERIYWIRKPRQSQESNGNERFYVGAYDSYMLLDVRIIYAAAGSAGAKKTNEADDMMKAFVRENAGASAAAARQWNASYFSVQADLAQGPILTDFNAPYHNLLTTLQGLNEASRANGTECFFDVVPTTPTTFEFRTHTGQLGTDRSQGTGVNPVLIGSEYGNLTEVSLTEHYEDEATVVYGGGQGEEAARTIVTVEDAARSGRSIWGRREVFQDARQADSVNGVTAAANVRLGAGEPWLSFTARLLDTPQAPYGDWKWGDKASASYKGQSYECIVKSVRVSVPANGEESIDTRLEWTG